MSHGLTCPHTHSVSQINGWNGFSFVANAAIFWGRKESLPQGSFSGEYAALPRFAAVSLNQQLADDYLREMHENNLTRLRRTSS